MNLNQLTYFHAVYTYQNVSAAAEYLHISQPSVSAAIKELEQEFGIKLFVRQHRGMVPTPEGELFFKRCEDILRRTEETEAIMHDLGAERKILRLGVPPMIGKLILPVIYRDFLSAYPWIRLEITEGGRGELLNKLSGDDLDMMFLSHNKPLEADLSAEKVTELEIVCCAAKGGYLADLESVGPADLAHIPLVLLKNSFFQTEEIKKWFAAQNVKPKILLQTEQLSTMQSMIASNLAVGFMFQKLIDKTEALRALPMDRSMFVDVSLVWKKDAYSMKGMKYFREYIHQKELFDKL